MLSSSFLLALGAWAIGSAAQDTTSPSTPTQTSGGLTDPCSSIQSIQSLRNSATSAGVALPTYPPSVAYSCMASIPINKDDATSLISWAQTYWPFLSTIMWLKNPPPSYNRTAFDVLGELQKISAAVNSSTITTQLGLDFALRNIYINTRDYHNNMFDGQALGMFTFRFQEDFSFVALSQDGKSLPKIYRWEDVINSQKALAVQSLNGQDPVQYLRNYTAANIGSPYIEEHAEWNTQMAHFVTGLNAANTTFLGSIFYNGDVLSVAFEDGSSLSPEVVATLNCDIRGATSMDAVYNACVLKNDTAPQTAAATSLGSFPTDPPISDAADPNQQLTTTAEAASETDQPSFLVQEKVKHAGKAQVPATTISFWPAPYPTNPVNVQNDFGVTGAVSGYNLKDDLIAVLSLPSFDKNSKSNPNVNFDLDYSNAVGDFIDISFKAGMKKVVIDVTGNGGGDIILGLEVFKRFFPDIWPYSGWNMRATPQITAMGRAFTNAMGNATVLPELAAQKRVAPADPFNVYGYLSDNGTHYTAWDQAGGPDSRNSDTFTYTIRYDYTNSTLMSNLGTLSDLYGYGDQTTNATRPWDPSNIILLTDGTCGSTCAVFSEMMKTEAGVKRVVMGGLPFTGPMQGVSGTRASQVLAIPRIANTSAAIRGFGPGADIELNLPPIQTPPRLGTIGTGDGGRVSVKNTVRRGSDVPLQFIYEAADCRLWYTADMIRDYTVLWKAAANVLSGNYTMCVDGSTNQVTAKPNVTSIDSPNATTIDNGAQASTAAASSPSGTSGVPPASSSAKSVAAAGVVAQGALLSFFGVLASALVLL